LQYGDRPKRLHYRRGHSGPFGRRMARDPSSFSSFSWGIFSRHCYNYFSFRGSFGLGHFCAGDVHWSLRSRTLSIFAAFGRPGTIDNFRMRCYSSGYNFNGGRIVDVRRAISNFIGLSDFGLRQREHGPSVAFLFGGHVRHFGAFCFVAFVRHLSLLQLDLRRIGPKRSLETIRFSFVVEKSREDRMNEILRKLLRVSKKNLMFQNLLFLFILFYFSF